MSARRSMCSLRTLTRDDHESRLLPSLLLADLNHDVSQPPLVGIDLVDAWDAAPDGVDERTLSSANRFAPPEAVTHFECRIDHVLFAPGSLGALPERPGSCAMSPAGYRRQTLIRWSRTSTSIRLPEPVEEGMRCFWSSW